MGVRSKVTAPGTERDFKGGGKVQCLAAGGVAKMRHNAATKAGKPKAPPSKARRIVKD